MIAVFKEFRLYCAHSVQAFGDQHKCARKHGHTYRIRVEVQCVVESSTNIAMPFDEVEAAWEKIGKPLDHTDLNDKFGRNPTTEVLAMYLHGQFGVELQRQVNVEIQETESAGIVIRSFV